MEGKDMMQSTVVKLLAIKRLKKKAPIVLDSQIGHISQTILILTQCPHK